MLLQRFQAFIREHRLFQPDQHLLLAVSGGLDSAVLCACCHQAGYAFSIAHCHFGLRGAESDRDEAFVRSLGVRYGVPVWVKHFPAARLAAEQKKSVETMARELRYAWFRELVAGTALPEDALYQPRLILTAHHADDNMESVVMHFFRGTGLAGIRGIQPRQGILVRPLLFARRTELEAWAADQQLDYVTDSSNLTETYTRNKFRLRILPQLQEVYPEAGSNLLRNIDRFSDAYILYRESVDRQLKKMVRQRGGEWMLPVEQIRRTPGGRSLLFEWIRPFGFTAGQLDDVWNLLSSGSGHYVASAAHRVIRHRKWLILAPQQTVQPVHLLVEEGQQELEFPGGVIRLRRVAVADWHLQTDPAIAQLDAAAIRYPLLLRPRQAGDYFYPLGMPKKKKLGRFLTDIRASLTEKENTWVLESDRKLVWVLGQRIDHRFRVTPATREVLLLTFKRKDLVH